MLLHKMVSGRSMSLRTRYSKQEFQEIIDRVVRVDGNESELSSDSDFGDANDNSDDEEVAFAKTSDTSGKRTAQHETGQTVPPSSSFDWQHYEFNDCSMNSMIAIFQIGYLLTDIGVEC
jgi:hypothetical protein